MNDPTPNLVSAARTALSFAVRTDREVRILREEIDRLREREKRLRAAAAPFANLADELPDAYSAEGLREPCRLLREALEATDGE